MKQIRYMSLLMVCIVLVSFFPYSAKADALYDWNISCRSKTIVTTTVYSIADRSIAIATLPANTYVKIGGGIEGWWVISYMRNNGQTKVGMVHSDTIGPAVVVTHRDPLTGQPVDVHELLLGKDNNTGNSSSSGSGNKNNSASAGKKTPVKTETAPPVKLITGEEVQVLRLGVAETVIQLGGEEKTVPTQELTFAEDVPQEKKIAVIHAPKTGKCTLRSKASDSGKALKSCKAGVIVSVLEEGGKYTKINYQGTVGYVLTSCLKFYDCTVETEGTGLLSYNGKTNGSTTINIRNAAKGDSAKIAEWDTGTEVTVFGLSDGWYEIEAKGIHGFVMEKFLTVGE